MLYPLSYEGGDIFCLVRTAIAPRSELRHRLKSAKSPRGFFLLGESRRVDAVRLSIPPLHDFAESHA
jgi:hypothetical protein